MELKTPLIINMFNLIIFLSKYFTKIFLNSSKILKSLNIFYSSENSIQFKKFKQFLKACANAKDFAFP